MQAVDYVVRDASGRLFRGALDSQTNSLVLQVSDFDAVSLNLSRDLVDNYVRVGDSLVIKLEDGRELVLEDLFIAQNEGTQLYLSSGGEIYEISFSESWGRTNYAHYGDASATDGLIFEDGAQFSQSFTGAATDVGYSTTTGAAGAGISGETAAVGAGVVGLGLLGSAIGGGGAAAGTTAATTATTVLPFLSSNGGVVITSAGGGADRVINGQELQVGPQVTGTTFANTLVTVTMAGVTLQTMSDGEGNYSVTFDGNSLGVGNASVTVPVTASVVDSEGETKTTETNVLIDPTTSVVVNDTTIEVDGIVLKAETTDGLVVTGVAEPNAQITVNILGVTRNVTAGADGTWSITFDGSVVAGIDGNNVTVSAQATDLYGNTAVTSETIFVDTVLNVAIGDIQMGDNAINRDEASGIVTITGTGSPDATIMVTLNNVNLTTTVLNDGTWSVDFPSGTIPTEDVQLTVTAQATDVNGNVASDSHTIAVDHQGFVQINPAPLEIDDVVNATEAADGLVITGTTTPGSTVVVQFQTYSGEATVGANGSWTFVVPASEIAAGTYDVTITASATTATGNTSSDTETVSIDTEVLNFTSSDVATDNVVNAAEVEGGVTLSGTVEPNSTVAITIGNVTKYAAIDVNGNWTVTFGTADIPAGDYQTTMTAVATDAAGNAQTITQAVQVDTVGSNLEISSLPIAGDGIVNAVEAGDGIHLTGTGDPGIEIAVSFGDVDYTTTVTPEGTWTIYLTPEDIGTGTFDTTLTVQTTDDAGNVTIEEVEVTVDTEVTGVSIPEATIGGDGFINAAEAAAGIVISGTAEPGATIVFAIGNQEFEGQSDEDGNFAIMIDPSAFPSGTVTLEIDATITDPAGNVQVLVLNTQLDTEVTNFAITATSMDGHTVLNSIVAQSGVMLSGTGEPNATIMVTFAGTTKAATVNPDGSWSVNFQGAEVPVVENEIVTATVVFTDQAGNSTTETSDFLLDTSIPAAPDVTSVSVAGGMAIDSLKLNASEGDYQIHAINADASDSSAVSSAVYQLSETGELYFDFRTEVDLGNDLIVQLNDDAGNSTSTLFVMNEQQAGQGEIQQNPTVNMGDAGYDSFNIEAVDMVHANQAELTITEEQLRDLSDLSDSLLVRGGEDDTVRAIGAVRTGDTQEINGETYDIYTLGDNGAYMVIDQDITVITA